MRLKVPGSRENEATFIQVCSQTAKSSLEIGCSCSIIQSHQLIHLFWIDPATPGCLSLLLGRTGRTGAAGAAGAAGVGIFGSSGTSRPRAAKWRLMEWRFMGSLGDWFGFCGDTKEPLDKLVLTFKIRRYQEFEPLNIGAIPPANFLDVDQQDSDFECVQKWHIPRTPMALSCFPHLKWTDPNTFFSRTVFKVHISVS